MSVEFDDIMYTYILCNGKFDSAVGVTIYNYLEDFDDNGTAQNPFVIPCGSNGRVAEGVCVSTRTGILFFFFFSFAKTSQNERYEIARHCQFKLT